MDSIQHLVPSDDISSIIAPKMQWNLQMSLLSLHEVKEECLDEESTWNDFTYQPEAAKLTEYKLQHNSEYDELKEEFYEEEHSGSSHTLENRIVFEDNEILKFIENNPVLQNNNNTEEELFINVKDERKYQFTVKTERIEEDSYSLDEIEDTSVHYDTLVTLREVQCNWCKRIFKNSFDLLKHNIGHMKLNVIIACSNVKHENIKLKRNRRVKNKTTKLYYCEKCKSHMKYDNRKWHEEMVHCSTKDYHCGMCGKQFKCIKYLQKHITIHTLEISKSIVQCNHCNKGFKHKYNLSCHIKNCHSNVELKCDKCDKVFKSKPYLLSHIKRIHHNYGKLFVCLCGKKFLSPRRLSYHKRAQHLWDSGMKKTKL